MICDRGYSTGTAPIHPVERLSYADGEVFGGERLLQEGIGRVAEARLELVALGVAGHVDDAHVGVDRGDPLRQLEPAQVGHDHVGQHQVNAVLGPVENAERLAPVPRLQHDVALVGENAGGERPDGVFVLDQQDGLAAAHRRGRPILHRVGQLVGADAGEADLEAAALVGRGIHPDVAPALHDDAVHRGQAEAGVERGGLGREERLEEV